MLNHVIYQIGANQENVVAIMIPNVACNIGMACSLEALPRASAQKKGREGADFGQWVAAQGGHPILKIDLALLRLFPGL